MKRISGITYLKAILPIFVIACHIRPFGKSPFMSLPLPKFPNLNDIFNANILSLVVPLFFIISVFLYIKKRQRTDNHTKLCFSKALYLFSIFIVVRTIYFFFGLGNIWVKDRGIFKNLYALFFGGGDTLLYYLEICVYLIVLTELYLTVSEKLKFNKTAVVLVGFAGSIALIFVLHLLPFNTLKLELMQFYSPVCFLPYIFVASFFAEKGENIKSFYLAVFILIGLAFAVLEWFYCPNKEYLQFGYSLSLPWYPRVSVVLISSAVFGFCLKIKKTPCAFTQYLAKLSLYVYCVHQIIINLLDFWVLPFLIKYCIVVFISYILSALIQFAVSTVRSRIKAK